mgnify:CR=1 FL=1
MTTDTRDVTEPDYWKSRGLEPPGQVYTPDSIRALRRRIAGPSESARPIVIVGTGSHLRPSAVTAEPFDAVVTRGCDRIQSIDSTSGTVTVEAGVRWGELRHRLRDEGLQFAPNGLYPADSTVGGLLASARVSGLGPDVAAMTACTASGRDYSYAEAPRKAAGPDMRYLFIGCEGAFGVILTVTLALRPRPDARLWRFSGDALESDDPGSVPLIERLGDHDIRAAWSWFDESEGVWDVAVHGPEAVLEPWSARAREVVSPELEVLGAEACRDRRDVIEAEQLPDDRNGGQDRSTQSRQPGWFRHIKSTLDRAGALAVGRRPADSQPDAQRNAGGDS